MHAAAAANDPPLLLARNLLGGPLRTTSAAVTGRGGGNTCMHGAIVELVLGSPTQCEAHETPRESLHSPSNCCRLVFHYYVERPRPLETTFSPSLLLRPPSVSDLPDEGHFSCDDDDENTKDRTVILFCSVCRHRSTRGMNRLLRG